VKKTARTYSRS